MLARMSQRPWYQAIGPGLIWAGTAVGVSHLVQSTRAGAGYGLSLWWLVLLALVLKYPGFEAGPRYAAATGRSLLEGYRKRGSWTLGIFAVMTLGTMFTAQAAVTIVTAGMASALISDALPVWGWSAVLLAMCGGLLVIGRFTWLERLMKAMMLLLTASTLLSVLLVLPNLRPGSLPLVPPKPLLELGTVTFLVGLMGWMPAPLDTAVWQSLWGLEKARGEGRTLEHREARFDFDVGYVGTAVLAFCFLFLGAAVLHSSGHEIPSSGGAFAILLVKVYTEALGSWARPIILTAAMATMFSTTLTVLDGFPRALEGTWRRLQGPEAPGEVRTPVYFGALAVLILGAQLIITRFTGNLLGLIDLATVLSFLTAPIFGALNLWVLLSDDVPEALRPRGGFFAWHVIGFVFNGLLVLALAWSKLS